MNLDKRKEKTKLLLEDLNKASKLVDSVCRRSRILKDDFNLSSFRFKTAKALSSIYELEAELFDLEPTLVPDYLKPSLEPIDLNIYLEHLLSAEHSEYSDDACNKAVKDSTIKGLKSYMTDLEIAKFSEAIKSDRGYEFAKQWWSDREKPFIPIIKVYKELKNDRRFIRFQAAKLLEKEFKVKIWDKSQNDVDLISINHILAKLLEED